MKITVIGSTGKTGIEIIKKALSEGHKVTAFLRDPTKLDINDDNLNIVQGDIFAPESITKAIENQDSVIIALGTGQSLGKSTVRSIGTSNTINVMKKENVNRLVVVSAMGVGESWKDMSLFNRFFFATLLKNSRADHEAQEQFIKKSELDWTIIRPSGLTDDPGTGQYDFGAGVKSKTSRIARADVAHLILETLKNDKLVKKAVTITN
jgi:putative NADH-flavin reductase